MGTNLVLHLGGRRRERVVRCARGDDDQVDIGTGHTGIGKCPLGGVTGKIGRLFAIGDNVALRDAGALTYPLVAGIHHSGKVMVAHDPLRQVSANRNHERPAVRHLLSFSPERCWRALWPR